MPKRGRKRASARLSNNLEAVDSWPCAPSAPDGRGGLGAAHSTTWRFFGPGAGGNVHGPADRGLAAMVGALVAAPAARLDRRVAFSVSITDREIYLSIGTDTLTGVVTRLAFG